MFEQLTFGVRVAYPLHDMKRHVAVFSQFELVLQPVNILVCLPQVLLCYLGAAAIVQFVPILPGNVVSDDFLAKFGAALMMNQPISLRA